MLSKVYCNVKVAVIFVMDNEGKLSIAVFCDIFRRQYSAKRTRFGVAKVYFT